MTLAHWMIGAGCVSRDRRNSLRHCAAGLGHRGYSISRCGMAARVVDRGDRPFHLEPVTGQFD